MGDGVVSRWAVRWHLPSGGEQGGTVAPWRDPTLRQCGQSGIGGACRVAVRWAVGGIAVGGEAAIAGSRLAGWLGRTMARPYIVAGWALWTNKGQHFLLVTSYWLLLIEFLLSSYWVLIGLLLESFHQKMCHEICIFLPKSLILQGFSRIGSNGTYSESIKPKGLVR